MNESEDPEGLRVFYYLVQDLKALVFSLISLHFKVCPSCLHLCAMQRLICHRSNPSRDRAIPGTANDIAVESGVSEGRQGNDVYGLLQMLWTGFMNGSLIQVADN